MAEQMCWRGHCQPTCTAEEQQERSCRELSWKTMRRLPRRFLKRSCLESLGLVAGDWRAVQQSACRSGCAVGRLAKQGNQRSLGIGPPMTVQGPGRYAGTCELRGVGEVLPTIGAGCDIPAHMARTWIDLCLGIGQAQGGVLRSISAPN
jgi:hypothetical protein